MATMNTAVTSRIHMNTHPAVSGLKLRITSAIEHYLLALMSRLVATYFFTNSREAGFIFLGKKNDDSRRKSSAGFSLSSCEKLRSTNSMSPKRGSSRFGRRVTRGFSTSASMIIVSSTVSLIDFVPFPPFASGFALLPVCAIVSTGISIRDRINVVRQLVVCQLLAMLHTSC